MTITMMTRLDLVADLLPGGWQPKAAKVRRYAQIPTPGECSECKGTGEVPEDQDGIFVDEVCVQLPLVGGEPCAPCDGEGYRMESRGVIVMPAHVGQPVIKAD